MCLSNPLLREYDLSGHSEHFQLFYSLPSRVLSYSASTAPVKGQFSRALPTSFGHAAFGFTPLSSYLVLSLPLRGCFSSLVLLVIGSSTLS